MPDLLDESARTWIAERSLLLAKSINKTTMEAIRNELALGFEAGESIPQISKRIESYFTDNAKYRANMVSRTEVVTASNRGANDRYRKEGVKEVEWLASPDACAECASLDGAIFPIDSGPRPSLHPHCRCKILSVIPD